MLAIFLCFGAIALIDLMPLIHSRSGKNIAAFCVIFALALAVSVLNQFGMPLPSSVLALDTLMRDLHLTY